MLLSFLATVVGVAQTNIVKEKSLSGLPCLIISMLELAGSCFLPRLYPSHFPFLDFFGLFLNGEKLTSEKSENNCSSVNHFLLKMSLRCKFFCFSEGKKRFKRHLTEKRIFLFLSNLLFLHSKTLEIENSLPQLMCINHSSWQHPF